MIDVLCLSRFLMKSLPCQTEFFDFIPKLNSVFSLRRAMPERNLRLWPLGAQKRCPSGEPGHLALLLQRNNKHAEAAEYWRRYLANDAQSEWAARARRSLKFCEMQVHISNS